MITAGQPATFTWKPTTPGPVTLTLRSGAASDLNTGTTIAAGINNSGSYTFTLPADTTRNSDYTIEISDDNNPDDMNYTQQFVVESKNTVESITPSASTSATAATAASSASSASIVSTASTASSVASSASSKATASTASAKSASTKSSTTTGSSMSTAAATTSGSSTSSTSSSTAAAAPKSDAGITKAFSVQTCAMAALVGLLAVL
ncbi:hypothetical protein P7C71_g1491, partial [Lecanoromycetidae sp. Uapishka_2]